MVDVDGIRAGLMFFDALIRKAETAILKEVAENERTRS